MEEMKPLFTIVLGALKIDITSSIMVQWIIIILVAILAKVSTSNLKKVPDKKQSVVEMIFEAIRNLVSENMGEEYIKFVPYVGTLAIFILIMNFTPLIGVKAPTEDLSVAAGLALISFIIVQFNAIKRVGLGHYFKAYTEPVLPLLPLNIVERLVLPVSLSLRLFGNLTAGAVVLGMIYGGMGHMAFLIPIPFHAFFDLFDGSIQMIVFVMLTMMNIKIIAEH
ncbi:F0F1 ATP synthase subunit A [Clostridium thailandense]|uniref:ATP synthase subunit a n=1 Tax=Clostridium thailandense TaxID=2794346 RepID=A0A949TKU9_9CLOT|nr:F0F1 ATP synthase subunit A [Clostridium thailandense]MBV7272342.1 F0F1 ATP synthase subunit A [Clostridium thailandense]MCH5135945.1 F0F1 ATP synthase subunit A [Clostridiaceae bacterium UIB06]